MKVIYKLGPNMAIVQEVKYCKLTWIITSIWLVPLLIFIAYSIYLGYK